MLRSVLPLSGFLLLCSFCLVQVGYGASNDRYPIEAGYSSVPDSFYVEELTLPGVLDTPSALGFYAGWGCFDW